VNIENRNLLDGRLKKRGSRLFKNLHVSGHAGREDLRDFLEMTKPEHIIPAHGGHDKTAHLITLAKELGYKDKYLHLTSNAKRLTF
jgi:ribonuclease J